MSKAAAQAARRKPQSFTGKDLDLLRETLSIPHESRTLVFEFLAHTHPEHSMKSWHSFYHKKVNILGPIVTQPNPPPETFTPEEEEALVTFLASGGSFMVDTTLLLYNQPYLRSEASWAKFYHTDKSRFDVAVAARRGQHPVPREEHDGSYLDAMLGSTSVQLGVDPSVARYLPNHTLSRVPPPEHHHLAAIDHHQAQCHPHYPHITGADAPEQSPSPVTGIDGNGHHYHLQHQHASPSQGNGVPVPYQHDYASSSHGVFHQHHEEYEAAAAAAAEPSHSQIDPSLRPQAQGSVSELPGNFEAVNGEQLQRQRSDIRSKKRRRAKDGTGSAGANATVEPLASRSAKRRKRDAAASPLEEDELLQHPPSLRHDNVQNGEGGDAEHVQGSPDVPTSHSASSAVRATSGYLVNT